MTLVSAVSHYLFGWYVALSPKVEKWGCHEWYQNGSLLNHCWNLFFTNMHMEGHKQLPVLSFAQLCVGHNHVQIKQWSLHSFANIPITGILEEWSSNFFIKPRNLHSNEMCPVTFYINRRKKWLKVGWRLYTWKPSLLSTLKDRHFWKGRDPERVVWKPLSKQLTSQVHGWKMWRGDLHIITSIRCFVL